jgi:hypothetical protein
MQFKPNTEHNAQEDSNPRLSNLKDESGINNIELLSSVNGAGNVSLYSHYTT